MSVTHWKTLADFSTQPSIFATQVRLTFEVFNKIHNINFVFSKLLFELKPGLIYEFKKFQNELILAKLELATSKKVNIPGS